LYSEAKENASKESHTEYQNLMRDYVNSQNKLILCRIDLNDQIKQIKKDKKDNDLLLKQKEDRIEQLENDFKQFKGQLIYFLFF
jgi:hypothetical protein